MEEDWPFWRIWVEKEVELSVWFRTDTNCASFLVKVRIADRDEPKAYLQ